MKSTTLTQILIAFYLAVGPTLTALVYEHVIDAGLATIIASGITTAGGAFHLGQAVTVGTPPALPTPAPK